VLSACLVLNNRLRQPKVLMWQCRRWSKGQVCTMPGRLLLHSGCLSTLYLQTARGHTRYKRTPTWRKVVSEATSVLLRCTSAMIRSVIAAAARLSCKHPNSTHLSVCWPYCTDVWINALMLPLMLSCTDAAMHQ
jgi:hypothetical protein